MIRCMPVSAVLWVAICAGVNLADIVDCEGKERCWWYVREDRRQWRRWGVGGEVYKARA